MKIGLYDPRFEHDACGVGFVANLDGKSDHAIIERGVTVLQNLAHRGAAGGDGKSGDGAGLLIRIPHDFLSNVCAAHGIILKEAGRYAVGMLFLPQNPDVRRKCENVVCEESSAMGFEMLGFREVPVNPRVLGELSRQAKPFISQCFISVANSVADIFERELYLLRRRIENRVRALGDEADEFYIASLSSRTIVYKGMMTGNELGDFYLDLVDQSAVSPFAIIHQRFSTNTFPSWKLAQPFRFLAHNGEINTLRGNIRQMRARQHGLSGPFNKEEIHDLLPIIDESGSDSACLDNTLELLHRAGRDLPHAMMMLIPQAWGEKYPIGPDVRGFFEYHSGLMEPWDGPAAVTFTDGNNVGALLDRNGLRPVRYTVTKDGFIVLASETGVLDFDPADIVERGALRPGQILIADLVEGRLRKDAEVKTYYARQRPYRRWVEENKIVLHGFFNDVERVEPNERTLRKRHLLFGYTREDIEYILTPMASSGHEPVGSMGNDTPLSVLSEQPKLLYHYFKQLFAQVTNPPIDPIRESLVMSLMTFMGNPSDILIDAPSNARLIKLPDPILTNEDIERLRNLGRDGFNTETIKIGFAPEKRGQGLQAALVDLEARALAANRANRTIVILSDRDLLDTEAAIPALLAVSTVHHCFIQNGIRPGASIIVETGEAREIHHMAVLLGHGATAVNPYLAFETVADLVKRKALDKEIPVTKAVERYIDSLTEGILKVMSKMGISTLRSYRNAQVFEAVGLNREVMERCFPGTESRIGGIGFDEIADEAIVRHKAALACGKHPYELLPGGGTFRFRQNGERHLWSPDAVTTLRLAAERNDKELYRKYAVLINDQGEKQFTLRGLFRLKKQTPIPLESVEQADDIMKRFVTSAMSFGSISKEAHETLAVAMNRIGGMSNSGEGGEDRARYPLLPNGDNRSSMTKQVASARFGVTAEYLVNARDLQIKIAQGAKPGEGGQLPGYKVNGEIAMVRHATPGVTLISPPPHHDIYSIEDLKQLIFDLKNVNLSARVSVKLVSEVGVGTVAAGVAKAGADMVLISGGDGGTGAAALSSIHHAGIPWEIGLSETQQTLVRNGLRKRIRVQCDGQLKTGRDVLIAALLGAEEFGFASAPLVVSGCVMMRACHQNICPAGIATQNPELRKRFIGKPEYVINFMRFVAEELRQYMAELGILRVDDLIGRTDLIEHNKAVDFWKARGLDFSAILHGTPTATALEVRCTEARDHGLDALLDDTLLSQVASAFVDNTRVEIESPITNRDRAVLAMLSGVIAKRYGQDGLPDDTIVCRFTGTAGQSFAAFGAHGLTAVLEGEANDYVGKGLSGAKVILKPPRLATFDPAENSLAGNVLLFGATGGELYVNGRVGERFAVRNSGADAVVEGIGDHGCEYMTGGCVVILGETGVNFGAGMSGGIAYVYDPEAKLDGRCNLAMIDLDSVTDTDDVIRLRGLLEKHVKYTGSKKAGTILDNFGSCLPKFVKVFPMEYRRALGKMMKEDEAVERKSVNPV
jgi:glutamate synthase (NADPH/NADH) large chain